jgi:hypothetical protein
VNPILTLTLSLKERGLFGFTSDRLLILEITLSFKERAG